ncbi:methionine synthase [Nocardiopsis exhalans]|uniref:Methionine synthase n=1 Tax=Nocardiopsis exhalans TaxID=163604 RepID=A0ABY5DBJ1_9ACTN|nr:methionine synthase [Nocardiopsis exhalans]USY21330.1 methionine synthase [Nocardiopsis exhalans]
MSQQQHYPCSAASATGVGSWPGEEPDEAMRTIVGELPDLPHLPELPARGAGADMIGRAAGLLVDLPVEVQPTGWRVVDTPGRDLARAGSFLSYDLDALTEHLHAYEGPLKVQLAGPWTLAASIELRNGQRLVSDSGAHRDLAESHLEGTLAHIADVRGRVPGAQLIVQIDEPSLPSVLLGSLPTASGLGRVPAVDRIQVEAALRALFAAIAETGAVPAAHCCAAGVPIDLLRRSGARALSVNALLLERTHDEMVGTAVEDGIGLLLGTVPATDSPAPAPGAAAGPTGRPAADRGMSDPATIVDPVRELWNRLGFSPDLLSRAVVTTPACGLAGASPRHARAALKAARDGARVLRDEPRK